MTNDDAKLLASLTGFTPGPWKLDSGNGEWLGGFHSGEDKICTFGGDAMYDEMAGEAPSEADAALIAAAPDLFRIATEQAAKIEAQAKEISALRIERGHVNDALQDMCDKMARALGDPV